MRLDYTLYILAAIFFVIAAVLAIDVGGADRNLWIITPALLGVLSLGLGVYQRPPTSTPAQTPPPAQPTETKPAQTALNEPQTTIAVQAPSEEPSEKTEAPVQEPIIESPAPTAQTAPISTEAAPAAIVAESPLIKVKGIGPKRVDQLKALGIETVDALANASAQDIAKSLKVSQKIVDKWVAQAKELVK